MWYLVPERRLKLNATGDKKLNLTSHVRIFKDSKESMAAINNNTKSSKMLEIQKNSR